MKSMAIIVFITSVLVGPLAGQIEPQVRSVSCEELTASIEVKKADKDIFQFKAVLLNGGEAEQTLRYRFSIERSGKSGNSDTSQGGSFEVNGRSEEVLSTSSMNIGQKDRCLARLIIYRGEEKICETTFKYPSK